MWIYFAYMFSYNNVISFWITAMLSGWCGSSCNEGPSSCAGHQGGATTAPAPTCYAKTRLASYSIRFLASQHFNTDNILHQCRAFILFLDVSTMQTFVYQFGIALRDA